MVQISNIHKWLLLFGLILMGGAQCTSSRADKDLSGQGDMASQADVEDVDGSQEELNGQDSSLIDTHNQQDVLEAGGFDGLAEETDEDSSLTKDGQDTAEVPSHCVVLGVDITCAHQTTTLYTDNTGLTPRQVHWQVPLGQPPDDGWPLVILFQGSYLTADLMWAGYQGGAFGLWHKVNTVKNLLDNGFAVLTPEAHFEGSTYWDSNIAPWNYMWETSPDHYFMLDIFEAIEKGTFGPLDSGRMYAGGISSGGYMTSRMAVAYPGRFRALVIHSASYATCVSAVCTIPPLPPDHPPTRFLHGELDTVVPVWTMELYLDALQNQSTEADAITDPLAAHEWIAASPEAVLEWFMGH